MNEAQTSHDPARRVAAVLAQRPEFRDDLPVEVEKQILHGGPDDRPPPQMPLGITEGIALAASLPSCAQFAWQVWRDTREDSETTARTLRLQVDKPSCISISQRDQIIKAVIELLSGRN